MIDIHKELERLQVMYSHSGIAHSKTILYEIEHFAFASTTRVFWNEDQPYSDHDRAISIFYAETRQLGHEFLYLTPYSHNIRGSLEDMVEGGQEYHFTQQCLKTWNMDHNHPQQISHAVHGLVGELIEFGDEHLRPDKDDEKIIDELGDVLYYRAILKFLMGDVAAYEPSDKRSVLTAINKFSDIAKKIAYHKTWDSDKVRTRYAEGIQYLDNYLTTVMTMRDLSLQQVQQHNINKLQGVNGRHTNGFNPNY